MTKHEDTTQAAGGSPLERGVRQLAGTNLRRLFRANRLLEELGHGGDTLAALEELQRLRAELQYARDGLTKGRSRMREDLERHKPLVQAVEWLVEEGHMYPEDLARLRAALDWLRPNACSQTSGDFES